MKPSEDTLTFAKEAVLTLGLLREDALPRVAEVIDVALRNGMKPKDAAKELRLSGALLSLPDRKRLGIEGRLRISQQGYDMLTEVGRDDPAVAFDATVTRAMLAKLRSKSILSDYSQGTREWTAIMPFPDRCDGCKSWPNKVLPLEDVDVIGPHNCFREFCAIAYAPRWQSIRKT